MSNRRWSRWMYALVPASALLLATGVAIWTSTVNAADKEAEVSKLEGKPAPEVSLQTLDGKPFKLSELKGNVVVLDFWATWCPPCRESLPHVEELSKNKELTDKGLRVFAVNAEEGKDQVEAFMKKNKYTFAVPMDAEGKAAAAFQVEGIPMTVVVGRDGKVRKVLVGFVKDAENEARDTTKQLKKAIDAALQEKAPSA